jgi:two-component system, sporulation sensor kinase E
VSSGLDITDFKSIQERLRKTERIAELGTLASGMAHEIGTPMNVILGRAEYLLQRTADEGMKKGLATIVIQIERITKVMNQLLAFARRKTPERRAVDLGEIVEDSLEMFQERIAHSRIMVEKAIEADIPSVRPGPAHSGIDQSDGQ